MATREGFPEAKIALWDLDVESQVANNRKLLDLVPERRPEDWQSDPMLFTYRGDMWCAYTAETNYYFSAKQEWIKVSKNGDLLDRHASDTLNRYEKSWMFFEHPTEGLLAVYHPSPVHVVIGVESGKRWATPGLQWNWGNIRGSTQVVLHNGRYYTLVHSAKLINEVYTYFVGWYSFEPNPPFKIVEFSKRPMMTPDGGRSANGLSVVFPRGLARWNDQWLISYGYHDCSVRLLKTPTLDRENAQVQGDYVTFLE